MRCERVSLAALLLSAGLVYGADEHAILKGLAYGPFRDGQRPGAAYPSEAEIRADLEIMSRLTPKIRTYGTENIFDRIPGWCAEYGLDCYPGAWLDRDLASNNQQILGLATIAGEGHPTTKGLIVGNEVLLRGDLSQDDLIAYIDAVKAATGLPVTTADSFHLFLDEAYDPLANAVDFLCIHIHPWWYNVHITNAIPAVVEVYQLVKDRWPGKEVILGEVGWPSEGTLQDPADPTPENFGYFLGGFQAVARWLDIDYFYFSAFDEAWKVEPYGVGPHWGVMRTDRTPKPGLNEMVAYYTSILAVRPGEVVFQTFEGAKYEIQYTEHLFPPGWGGVDVLTGAGDTNQTTWTVPLSPAPTGAYRSRWIP